MKGNTMFNQTIFTMLLASMCCSVLQVLSTVNTLHLFLDKYAILILLPMFIINMILNYDFHFRLLKIEQIVNSEVFINIKKESYDNAIFNMWCFIITIISMIVNNTLCEAKIINNYLLFDLVSVFSIIVSFYAIYEIVIKWGMNIAPLVKK
jgi:hypothetical protein